MQRTINTPLHLTHFYRHIMIKLPILLSIVGFLTATQVFALDDQIPPPPNLAVKSYLLKDFNSQHTIASYKSKARVEPASLTKVMTAYLTFKALKNGHLQAGQNLPVSTVAWQVEGSKMFIEPNKAVTVDELLHGLIIQSGNDAAMTLAEGIASSETMFADMMNKEAARLGMKDTHYMNATGLPDPAHFTTAEDLVKLATALIHDFPEQYQRLYSVKEYTYNQITQSNRNRLLWLDPNVDGMKTGHTSTAGYCLISSAKRGQTRYIAVVLGAPSETARATESQKLLNYAFQFYDSHLVYKKAQQVSLLKVWKGVDNSLSSTVLEDMYVTIPKGSYKNVKAQVSSTQPLVAPIKKGQQIGEVKFVLNGKIVDTRPIVAANAVPMTGMIGRAWDTMKLMLQ